MSKNLHVIPKITLSKDLKFDKSMGCITLPKAGNFTVEIVPTEGLYNHAPKKLAPFRKLTQEEVWKMPDTDDRKLYVASHKTRDAEEVQYDEQIKEFNEKLAKELDTLSWCWEVVGNSMDRRILEHNTTFVKGMPKDGEKQIYFPEILVGGGFTWLEVFTKNDPALGTTPSGLFVCATGVPKIVRVAWTDLNCKPIKEKIKFGSTVLLNIYTTHLYGQDVEVALWDKDTADPNDLLPISNKGNFNSEVLIHKLLPNEINKSGISGGILIKGESETHVQKIRIPVLIDLKWMFSARKRTENLSYYKIKGNRTVF